MQELLVIIGSGGQAKVIIDSLNLNDFADVIIIDANAKTKKLLDIPIVDRLSSKFDQIPKKFIVAIGDNYKRWQVVQTLLEADPKAKFHTSIHATAVVCKEVLVGEHVIVNTRSTIDHDCVVGDYASISPNVTLGGGVEVGNRSFIGISTTVLHKIKIACDVIVGADSLLNKNVEKESSVWFGRPAEFKRLREKNDPFL